MLPRTNASVFFYKKNIPLCETVAVTLKSVARLGAMWHISLVPIERCRCVCGRHHARQLINIITGRTARGFLSAHA